MPSGLKVSSLPRRTFCVDRKAFAPCLRGLYLGITAKAGVVARTGCMVNTLMQVASRPATLSVSPEQTKLYHRRHPGVRPPRRHGARPGHAHGAHQHLQLHICRRNKFAMREAPSTARRIALRIQYGLARLVFVTETIDGKPATTCSWASWKGRCSPLATAHYAYHAVKGGKTHEAPPTTAATGWRFPASRRTPAPGPGRGVA